MVLVALLTGYVLGLTGARPANGPNSNLPSHPTNPRSFNP
jgi:hypothetical protein